MPVDSAALLSKLGYEYYSFREEGVEPDVVDLRFSDVLPSLSGAGGHAGRIAGQRLYRHQYEAYRALSRGNNVVLISGTGSGKTEAWLLYTLKERAVTLAVYPTLALANDQVNRISDYGRALGISVTAIDAKRRSELFKRAGSRKAVKDSIRTATVVITNPAFLLQDLKRWAANPGSSLFAPLFRRLKLIVLDEFDFYGPREHALLLSMLKIISWIAEEAFQVAVLTATLGNPSELAAYLTEITGRDTDVIDGKPFRVPNRTYLVMGKNLRSIWEVAKRYREEFIRAGVGSDVIKALDDYDVFKREVYKVVLVAEAIGISLPKPYLDPVEILKQYIDDEGVTLVFTRSIARAEEIGRKLRRVLPDHLRGKVATHHHLISKEVRELVERGAREGTVKVIISPRTLSQGIDIGTIVRIVHIGLPDSVREFHQREGRKGRRKGIEFTETIVIPASRWDRELLARGAEVVKQWMELPLEKTLVNRDNKYGLLLEAMFKVVSGASRAPPLTREEHELLKTLGLVEGNELSRRGRSVWLKLNFYEFAPPYGIKRIKVVNGNEVYLEDISFCDLVEKFQPGCIDYTEDAIVTHHKLGGKSGRVVTAVVEEPLREGVMWRHDALAYALEEYEKIKAKWGEEANVFSDYLHGRLHSEVICVVNPPIRGFGRYTKIPNRVLWIVEGEKARIVTSGERTLPLRDRRVIEVPTATYGKYNDYTYGVAVELDPSEDLTMLRIGLAYLMVVLRVRMQVPFETIMYSLGKAGEKKVMVLHEPEAAGLLEKIDWLRVLEEVRKFEPDDLTEILMQAVDEDAHTEFAGMGLRWDLARESAVRAIEYLLLRDTISVKISGEQVYVPRPSRALRLVCIDAISLPLDEEGNIRLTYAGLFDGEAALVKRILKEYYLIGEEARAYEAALISLVDKGFSVLVYNFDEVKRTLLSAGLGALAYMLDGLKSDKRVVDVHEEVCRWLGVDRAPLEEVLGGLGLSMRKTLLDVCTEYEESRRLIRDKPYSKWLSFTKYLSRTAEEYLTDRMNNVYILHLIALKKLCDTELA